ncbi:unnamed protein product [Rotaria sordida]|uniref:ADP ribosyltransferase domain-containing protein n=1 Tax=Rotaria sordida TaxID=392033 RepID=A0A814DCU5_9BILA|nr:unnamed protein product [Rotaria sordida]
MHEEEFEILKANIGNLISPNGFFSTSKDLNVALIFAGEDDFENKSILFEIRLDPTKIKNKTIVGAPIENFSRFPEEKEVLFSIGTTFRIENIMYDVKLKIWRVPLTLTDDGLEHVQQYVNSMRKDLAETNPTRLFGKLLIDMGQYSRAERYYELILNSLPKNHEDFPSLYHGLGYTHYVRGNYTQALKYDKVAYEIRKQILPENHLDIARSSLNLGCDYIRNGDHKTAMELLMEALRIRQQNYSEQDHVNIAIVCAAIGDNYIHLCDYENAFNFLTKALEMFKRVLPSEHAKIASTLIKIGNLWEKQGFYDRALEQYHSAHSMAVKIMPSEHPTLQKYFERIIYIHIMLRIINSSNRALAQRIVRPILTVTRAEIGTDAEAGSVASGNDAFSKKEHAEESRWARRHDAEQIAKYRAEHSSGNRQTTAQGTLQQRLGALETEKRRIEQEIEQIKRQQC